jgi:hypothetical protein
MSTNPNRMLIIVNGRTTEPPLLPVHAAFWREIKFLEVHRSSPSPVAAAKLADARALY